MFHVYAHSRLIYVCVRLRAYSNTNIGSVLASLDPPFGGCSSVGRMNRNPEWSTTPPTDTHTQPHMREQSALRVGNASCLPHVG